MDPAHLRVMGVPDDRRGQPDLGFSEAGCVAERRKVRRRIVGGVEAVGIDVLEIGDRRLGAGIRLTVGDPQRRIASPGIECVDGGPILLDADDAVEFAAREIVQLFGDGGVRTACCRGRGGRLRRRGSIRAGRVGRIGCRRRRRGQLRQLNARNGWWGVIDRHDRRRHGLRCLCHFRGRNCRTGRRRAWGVHAGSDERSGRLAAGGRRQHDDDGGRGQRPGEPTLGHRQLLTHRAPRGTDRQFLAHGSPILAHGSPILAHDLPSRTQLHFAETPSKRRMVKTFDAVRKPESQARFPTGVRLKTVSRACSEIL